jgi:hypothetical protein
MSRRLTVITLGRSEVGLKVRHPVRQAGTAHKLLFLLILSFLKDSCK